MRSEPRASGKVGGLPEAVAGALAYLSFIPAIVFLFVKPFKKSRFVRFHSLQCLLSWGAGILLALGVKLASLVLFIIPVLGPLLVLLVSVVVGLGIVMTWLVLLVKALQGETYELPVIGDFAAQWAAG